jgi:hypothetical protein
MNARLIKETRDLLPFAAATVLLIVMPCLILKHNHAEAAGAFGTFAFGLGCAIMGGVSFGNEFQRRTFSLLLSQPIPRSAIWREKMLVLGGSLLLSLAAIWLCVAFYGPRGWADGDAVLVPLLVAVCAFCGAPCGTLLSGKGTVGAVLAAGVPCGIAVLGALLGQAFRFTKLGIGEEELSLPLVILYLPFAYWLGYSKFTRMEALETPAQELKLPARLEAIVERPLAAISARLTSPVGSLIKKELRLQQVSFILAGAFCLFALAGAILNYPFPSIAEGVWAADYAILIMILPLVAGAVAVSEERTWGISDWQLTLPPSALKQWSVKSLTALSISLLLGLALPVALFALWKSGDGLPPFYVVLVFMLGQLAMTSAAVYAGSVWSSTMWAILSGLGIFVGLGGWSVWVAVHTPQGVPVFTGPAFEEPVWTLEYLRWIYAVLASFGLLCLLQWFAFCNFRRRGSNASRLVLQFLALLIFPAVCWDFILGALFLSRGM